MTRLTVATLTLAASIAALPLFGALPVMPAKDQAALLKSSDSKLARNKKNAYDFFRVCIRARHMDQADKYMTPEYMQHNPNAETGEKGFKDYFTKLGPPAAIAPTLDGLVAIQAEGDYVTLSFVREMDDPKMKGKKYTTTWFDMLRFDNDGKIVEHWDPATK